MRRRVHERLGPELLGAAATAIVAVGEILQWHWFRFVGERTFGGDSGQHVWWMRRWRESGMFPDDVAADYFSAAALQPPGHWAVMRLASVWYEPLAVAEFLPLVLTPLAVMLAYLIGRRIGGLTGGLAALGLFVFAGCGYMTEGGYARSHALPAFLLAAWGWLRRDGVTVGAALVYAALFYPPIAVQTGLTTLVLAGVDVARERSWRGILWRRWPWGVGGGVLAMLLLGLFVARDLPEAFGPQVTYAQALAGLEFGPDGRNAFFSPNWREFWFEGQRSGLGWSPETVAGVGLLVLAIALWRPRAIPAAAWATLAVSLGLWALAHAVLFRLYLPNRYVFTGLPMFVLMAAAAAGGLLAPRPRPAPLRSPARARYVAAAVAAAVGLAVLYLPWRYAGAAAEKFGAGYENRTRDYGQQYEVVRRLPADMLFAAHPRDGVPIPLLTGRSVLVNHETHLPYHRGYYDVMKPRVADLMRAYYSPDFGDVLALHEAYGVDVLLTDRRRLNATDAAYFAPFGQALPPEGEVPAAFAPPPERLLGAKDDLAMVWLGPIDEKPDLAALFAED